MNNVNRGVAASLALCALAQVASAAPTLTETIRVDPPSSGSQFSDSLDADGDFVVIGAPLDDTNGTNAGLAYIYRISTGALTQIEPALPVLGTRFGSPVSIDGSDIVVGATGGLAPSPGVYHFDATLAAEVQVLTAPSGAIGSNFGWSVGVSDGIALVGDPSEQQAGQAWLFSLSTGAFISTVDSFPEFLAGVGATAAIDGDDIALGSSGVEVVNIHDRLNVPSNGDLIRGDPSFQDFGSAIDLDDGILIVGQPLDDTLATNSGAAYLFDVAGNELAKLTPPDAVSNARFGTSVAIDGDLAVIGTNGTTIRAAFLYSIADPEQPVLLAELSTASPAESGFGRSVALDATHVFVGSPQESSAGAMYVFELEDCNSNGVSDLLDISIDPTVDCNRNGVIDSCEIDSAGGTSGVGGDLDCNQNGVIDVCEVRGEIEIVFVFDTSFSIAGLAEDICDGLAAFVPQSPDIEFSFTLLSILQGGANGLPYPCVLDSVEQNFGLSIPPGIRSIISEEDWADAANVIAQLNAWSSEDRHVVVVSDEGPRQGDGCNADDDLAITEAIAAANANGVRIHAVSALGSSTCNESQSELLANSTGGVWLNFTGSGASPDEYDDWSQLFGDLAEAIVERSIVEDLDLNMNGIADFCECPGDANGDFAVDLADLNIVLANFGGPGPGGDVTRDGVVDLQDLNLVLSNTGMACK